MRAYLLIQAGLFVSPVGYDIEGAPQNIQTLLSLNPVSGLIDAWRWAMGPEGGEA